MKRILPVLMSLVLVFSLIVIPAYATEKYVFSWSPEDKVFLCDYLIPDGSYDVFVYLANKPGYVTDESVSLYSTSPVVLTFNEVIESGSDPYFLAESAFTFEVDSEVIMLPFKVAHFHDFSLLVLDYYGDCTSGSYVVFTPVENSSFPSLSGIVDSGMMSGVLDQVVSLLPVLIVTIVTFIATRKGIAFLRGFLAGS